MYQKDFIDKLNQDFLVTRMDFLDYMSNILTTINVDLNGISFNKII